MQVDRFFPDVNASYIIVDNYKASVKGIELLIQKGYRRIAVICYDIDLNALTDRRQGYIDTMNRYDLLDPALIKNIKYEDQEEQIRQAIIDLKNNPDKVEAIFFCSRRVFITGIKHMHREGIKIPEEMEIICFDKIDTISIANIPIDYIEQPIRKMGEQAVEILIEQINGNDDIKQFVFDAEIKHSI